MLKKIGSGIKKLRELVKQANQYKSYSPVYKVEEINQDEEGQYIVVIRIINKSAVFHIKPEELLADDTLVDQFSPRDIRTLTYLGYLGVNAPKYKILAKRLSTQHDKIVFAIKKKGEKEVIIKTAQEILNEQEILASLNPEDAKVIGYTVATEHMHDEKTQKQKLMAAKNKTSS